MNIIEKDEIINPMSFIFISAPYTKAPFHLDPEHNFLFQIKGNKKFYLNNRLEKKIISDNEISDFYKDEINFELTYKDDYYQNLKEYNLHSGNGIYVPVTYPHLVNNTNTYSISYSLTFRSKFSIEHRNKYLSI
jgi:ribosomal protein L16 Arg81 hydroxylase